MKISFDFEAGNKKDAAFLGHVAAAIQSYSSSVLNDSEQGEGVNDSEQGKDVNDSAPYFNTSESPTAEDVKPAKEKPVTLRRKVSQPAAEEKQPEEPQPEAEVAKQDAPTPQAEVTKQDASQTKTEATLQDAPTPQAEATQQDAPTPEAEEPKTMTNVEFRRILDEKRKELGIEVHTEMSVKLSNYLKAVSEAYGSHVPSKLDPESLYKFVHNDLMNIVYDEENGVFTQKTPF